jgi:hypothetical protein
MGGDEILSKNTNKCLRAGVNFFLATDPFEAVIAL